MSYGTYLKFHHYIDIYNKVTTVSQAGQRTVTFNYYKTIPVMAQWVQSDIVNQPYIASFNQLELFVPKDYHSLITFDVRLRNLKDRYENVIDASYFEVIGIQKKMQFNSKVHHAVIALRKVVENSV
jgi:hypothetical protein